MSDPDLSTVPTRDLVAEAVRRAPRCTEHQIPMLTLRPEWFACPVCGRTQDFESGMPPTSADRMAKLEAIVRALAASSPLTMYDRCILCRQMTPDGHHPECPWRLARELIGDSE